MKHINYYNNFFTITESVDPVDNQSENNDFDNYINKAYDYYRQKGIKVSSKDILNYVIEEIGEEIPENEYKVLFKKVTGYNYGEKVKDIKFIIK